MDQPPSSPPPPHPPAPAGLSSEALGHRSVEVVRGSSRGRGTYGMEQGWVSRETHWRLCRGLRMREGSLGRGLEVEIAPVTKPVTNRDGRAGVAGN